MGSLDSDSTELPYWQVNVAPVDRTAECPEFLRNLSPKDLRIVSTPDPEYRRFTWDEVRKIAKTNRLDLFQRVPSDLRRYLGYNWKLTQEYGSVMNFVLTQRLQWEAPIKARGRPFEFEDDLKILWNDWPYGLDERIVHLVVWTKFAIEEDPKTGDLTDKARAEINDYVDSIFGKRLSKDRYIWFKNWQALKSIHSVEHFHVMIFDPDQALINEITHGDVPLCRKVPN